MDAVEYAKAFRRMCFAHENCFDCELQRACFALAKGQPSKSPEEYDRAIEMRVKSVEAWAEEHPIITRQSLLLKVFPNLPTDVDGVYESCPNRLAPTKKLEECVRTNCGECRKEFWLQEVDG